MADESRREWESGLGQVVRELRDKGQLDLLGKFEHDGRQAETSREAAVAIYPTTGTQRRKVLDAIASVTAGLTDEEIQIMLGMNPSTQRPRRVELVEQGWIEDSGKRRKTASGRRAVVWVCRG